MKTPVQVRDELEAENKALRERAESAEAALKVYDDELSGASSGATMEFIRRLKADKEKAESSFKERDLQMRAALEETESMFQRTQRAEAENVELREAKEKSEAACAEMRNALSHWFIKDDEGNYPDEAQYYTPTISPVARRILDSSTCGQPLLDRMKAMEDILKDCQHLRSQVFPMACFPECPACRWKAIKEATA